MVKLRLPGTTTAFSGMLEPRGSYLAPNILEVTCPKGTAQATLWTNTNLYNRDFRLETVGATWEKLELRVDPSTYKVKVTIPLPPTGAKAYFIEVKNTNEVLGEFVVTTPIKVIPEIN